LSLREQFSFLTPRVGGGETAPTSEMSRAAFHRRLAGLGFSNYQEYLASDHWADVRVRYAKSRMLKRCYVCDASQYQLHHRTYKRLGHEWLTDFIPLCRDCHTAVHEFEREQGIQLYNAAKKYRASLGKAPRAFGPEKGMAKSARNKQKKPNPYKGKNAAKRKQRKSDPVKVYYGQPFKPHRDKLREQNDELHRRQVETKAKLLEARKQRKAA
jgi:hypothetical protein